MSFDAGSVLGISTVRSAAILTTSYVGSDSVDVTRCNQIVFLVDFTIGSLTDMRAKVQFSVDGTNWYDEPINTTGTTSSGEYQAPIKSLVHKLAETASRTIAAPVLGKYARLAVKGEGTVTSSSCTIQAVKGVA
jgi:hypothetical protein